MPETPNATACTGDHSTNEHLARFNKVINNYVTAVVTERNSDWHRRGVEAVDALATEYTLAVELLDHVRGELCYKPIEHAYNAGEDCVTVAERCKADYPMLADDIDSFVAVLTEPPHAE